jgi:hypothetical protein
MRSSNLRAAASSTQPGVATLAPRDAACKPPPATRAISREIWALGAVTVLGAGLRLFQLGARSLWIGEATSDAIATLDVSSLVSFAPWAGAIAVSVLKPILIGRYLFACQPMFIVLAASGPQRFMGSRHWYPLIAVFVLSVAYQNFFYYRQDFPLTEVPAEDWRAAVKYVVDGARPGDGVVVYPAESRFGYDYYARHLALRGVPPPVLYPVWNARFQIDGAYAYARPAQLPGSALVQHISGSHSRIWLVFREGDPHREIQEGFEALRASLERGSAGCADQHFSGIEVLRCR